MRMGAVEACLLDISSYTHEFIAAVVIYTTLYKIWSVYVPSWTGRVIFFINVYTRQFPVFQ